MVVLRYSYIFCVGQNTHKVELYNNYKKNMGLIGKPIEIFEYTRFADLYKAVKGYLSKEQKKSLKSLAKEHCLNMIVLKDGEHYKF